MGWWGHGSRWGAGGGHGAGRRRSRHNHRSHHTHDAQHRAGDEHGHGHGNNPTNDNGRRSVHNHADVSWHDPDKVQHDDADMHAEGFAYEARFQDAQQQRRRYAGRLLVDRHKAASGRQARPSQAGEEPIDDHGRA